MLFVFVVYTGYLYSSFVDEHQQHNKVKTFFERNVSDGLTAQVIGNQEMAVMRDIVRVEAQATFCR